MKYKSIITMLTMVIIIGCKEGSPTEALLPVDLHPTIIQSFSIDNTSISGTVGDVVVHVGDIVRYEVVATDQDRIRSWNFKSSCSVASYGVNLVYTVDTIVISSGFLVDSSTSPGTTGYQPGTIVKNYITICDSLGFEFPVEIRCTVSQ